MPQPRDTPGTPEWKARLQADFDEYDSYVPQNHNNGRTGSTRVKNPKHVKTRLQTNGIEEGQ